MYQLITIRSGHLRCFVNLELHNLIYPETDTEILEGNETQNFTSSIFFSLKS